MHPVEPDGAKGKNQHLPGEIWRMRVRQKSAEAVVASMPRESGGERRAEEPEYEARGGTEERAKRDLEFRDVTTTVATPGAGVGRRGEALASRNRRFRGERFADLLTESNVRATDGRSR